MDDFFQRSLDACYAAIGVPGVFAFTSPLTMQVIDHTSAQDSHVGAAQFADIEPTCNIRVSELQGNGITVYDQLIGVAVTFNGNAWEITKYHVDSSPFLAAELRLQLRQLS